MGIAGQPAPVRLFSGLLARSETALGEAADALSGLFGPVGCRSPVVPFGFTDYYEREMGPGLLRQWVSFERPFDPGELAGAKRATNALERRLADVGAGGAPCRRVNLDPGYVAAASVILATTKNFAHRIYLADGIYAELTLCYRRGAWHGFDWTYPDYRTETAQSFFTAVRREIPPGSPSGRAAGGVFGPP